MTSQKATRAEVPATSTEARIQALRSTFATGRTRSIEWRLTQLRAVERLLTEGEAEIAAALSADLGRSANDTFLGDIAPSAKEAQFARKHLRKWIKPRRVGLPLSQIPGRGWYEYEPLGCTLVIGPWNYPIYLTIAPLVAAIAAGNCVIIKPSEHAPNAARVLRSLVEKYLDPDAFAVVEGGPQETLEILSAGVDLAFFTGGPEVGKAIMAAAAPHLTPVILELGGKCPVVIDKDANLKVTARRIAWTKLMNSGQTCIAPDYLMVHEDVLPQFQAELVAAFTNLSPNQDGGKLMPIVSARHAERLALLLDAHGGTVVAGGDVNTASRQVDLTLVVNPDLSSRLMTEEIFGPLLPILSISSVESAIEYIQVGPKPLAAYLFTESERTRRMYRRRVAAGAVVTNHISMHVLVPELPFGGVGNSGMGAYHGKWGFEAFSHRKAMLHRPTFPDLRAAYPPYSDFTQRLLRKIF